MDKLLFETENTQKQKLPPIITLNELLAKQEAELKWIVDDLLIAGGCSIMVSKPKTGKTTFTRCLCLSVATGNLFLGKKTRQSPALMIILEEKMSEVSRHFRKMTATGSEAIFFCETPLSPMQIRTQIIQNQISLVVIDTLVLGIKNLVDINDYLDTTRALNPYLHIARETDCHILFTHHLGKQERSGGDGILGSTGLFAAVDAVLVLDRMKQERTFKTIMRYGSDWSTTILTMKSNGSLAIESNGHDLTIESAVLRFLRSSSEPVTEKIITAKVYGRTSEKRRVLREMVKSGQVIRTGNGTKTQAFEYAAPSL